jgi:trimethylamine:corrinoid methyltransferase-like protein
VREGHLLIADHTRRHLKSEHHFPGPVIERANLPRWQSEGETTLGERASREVTKHLAAYEPSRLRDDAKRQLVQLMSAEAARHGMEKLPEREP